MSAAVRAGYKQTEVGVIPKDWEVLTFSELFSFRNGVNADKASYGQGTPFINVLEPITFSHLYGYEISGQVTLPEAVTASYAVRYGDVLFNRTSETQEEIGLAAAYIGSNRVVFGGFVIRGRPINSNLDPKFCGYSLRAPAIRSQLIPMGQGAIRANIGQQNLGRAIAAVPPLPEQRAIATALSDVDALLAKLDALIAKKRDLKVAAMQQLLTGQTRLPGFSGEWEVKRLGDVASATKGTQLHKSESNGIGLFAHLNGGITPSGFTSFSNTPGQTIAISEGGNSCGFVQFMNEPYWCGGHCYSIVPTRIEKGFLYHALKGRQTDIMGLRVGSGLPNVQKTALLNFSVSCPLDRSEQTAIATILSDMDTELAALEARRDKTQAIKQGMMQELLTGRIRLV